MFPLNEPVPGQLLLVIYQSPNIGDPQPLLVPAAVLDRKQRQAVYLLLCIQAFAKVHRSSPACQKVILSSDRYGYECNTARRSIY